jgi:hypothetical protein
VIDERAAAFAVRAAGDELTLRVPVGASVRA